MGVTDGLRFGGEDLGIVRLRSFSSGRSHLSEIYETFLGPLLCFSPTTVQNPLFFVSEVTE